MEYDKPLCSVSLVGALGEEGGGGGGVGQLIVGLLFMVHVFMVHVLSNLVQTCSCVSTGH